MLPSSYPIVLLRSSGRASLAFYQNPCTQRPFSTTQQSFKSYTFPVYQAAYNQRKVVPEKKDPNYEENSFENLEEALANSRKTNSRRVHATLRYKLIWNFWKFWTDPHVATGKTSYRGREFLGPHTPEVKRARKIAERLFLVLPDDHMFRRIEVIKNPGGTNAFATWDGVVLLDQGVLRLSYSDDLLAFLIGHEMAHQLLHHNEKAERRKWNNTLFAFQAFFTDLMGFRSVILAKLAYRQLLKDRKMSRDHEFEADEEGMMIAWKACYSPEAAIRFEEIRIEEEKRRKPEYKNADKPELKTHPPSEARAAHLRLCKARRAPEIERWWKKDQLRIFERKERQDAEKRAMEQLQKDKVHIIRQAHAAARGSLSLGNSPQQTVKETNKPSPRKRPEKSDKSGKKGW